LFVTDLRQIFDLPETENYVQFVNNYEAEHESGFNEKFLKTPAMEIMCGSNPCSVGSTVSSIKFVVNHPKKWSVSRKVIQA